MFFFFKQKTAYEMRISDWSSDVCSSDLLAVLAQWRAQARIAMTVYRTAFTPPPKVMSAVVHVTPIDAPRGVRFGVLERITAAAFRQPPKMLLQCLQGLPGTLVAPKAPGVSTTRPPEPASVERSHTLARAQSALLT